MTEHARPRPLPDDDGDGAAQEEAAAALSVRRVSAMDDLLSAEHLDSGGSDRVASAAAAAARGGAGSDSPSTGRSDSPDVTLGKAHVPGTTPYTPDVKLWHRAVVVHQENSLRGLVRQVGGVRLQGMEGQPCSSGPGGTFQQAADTCSKCVAGCCSTGLARPPYQALEPAYAQPAAGGGPATPAA